MKQSGTPLEGIERAFRHHLDAGVPVSAVAGTTVSVVIEELVGMNLLHALTKSAGDLIW